MPKIPGCGYLHSHMKYKNSFTNALQGGEKAFREMKNYSKTPPIFETSVFSFDSLEDVNAYLDGDPDLYMYSRLGNPNNRQLETRLSALESAEAAVVSSSGMAAVFAAVIGLMKAAGAYSSNTRIVTSRYLYGGTRSLFLQELVPLGFSIVEVDSESPELVLDALNAGPPNCLTILYWETVSNPGMKAADIRALTDSARSSRPGKGQNGCSLEILVDNTFLSPALFRPLEHGADGVVHSTTKYLNGHSDATGGAFLSRKPVVDEARKAIINFGSQLSPFESWLTFRGLQTLPLRMERHSSNALHIAGLLNKLPQIDNVRYPGLDSSGELFPRGAGGMLSFDLDSPAAAGRFIEGLEMISFSPSLAGLQSTVSYPASTSHRNQSDEMLTSQGISRCTIRLSVGLENPDDILQDIHGALKGVEDV